MTKRHNSKKKKGEYMDDTQADGYYDEPEMSSDELDLSFLDDDDKKEN